MSYALIDALFTRHQNSLHVCLRLACSGLESIAGYQRRHSCATHTTCFLHVIIPFSTSSLRSSHAPALNSTLQSCRMRCPIPPPTLNHQARPLRGRTLELVTIVCCFRQNYPYVTLFGGKLRQILIYSSFRQRRGTLFRCQRRPLESTNKKPTVWSCFPCPTNSSRAGRRQRPTR